MVKKFLLAAGFLSFAGCIAPLHRITYILDVRPEDEQRYNSVQNIYLLVRQPAQDVIPEAKSWATLLQKEMQAVGGNILASRNIPPTEPTEQDRFLKKLDPSLLMETQFQGFGLITHSTQKEILVGTTTATQHKEIQTTWFYAGVLTAVQRTYSGTDATKTWEKTFIITTPERSKINTEPNGYDSSIVSGEAIRMLAKQTAELMSPVRPVIRERNLLYDSQDKKQTEAVSLAAKKQWDKSADIWSSRLKEGHGTWKDEWNLGVSAEVNRNKTEAKAHYEKARLSCGDDRDAQKIPWDQILADLASSRTATPPSENAQKWFSTSMAIVPFEENTNSIDGPEFIRKKLHEKLKRGGYAVQDIDKADALFQAHGLSDGGQLPVFKREGLAVWTKSPHLLFGDIETFDEVNVGIYLKREIHALIHIWDATTKTDMYSCDKTVSTQSMAKNKNAVISQFVSGLAETWVEHASHKPMAPEVLQFVETCLDELPLRP